MKSVLTPPQAGDGDGFTDLQERFLCWTGNTLAATSRASAVESLSELASARELSREDYLVRADAQPTERQTLIERLLIRTTWFMREPETLQALATAFRRRVEAGGSSRVTLWSVGCASGEEPYSLAMLCLEAGLDPLVLATDLSSEARAAAEAGEYRLDRLDDLPPRWRQRYFEASPPSHPGQSSQTACARVSAELRARVTVLPHNLADTTRPPVGWATFDAIVCRNVLLYFQRPDAQRILRELSRHLRLDGYLVLSAAEQPLSWTLPGLISDGELPLLRREASNRPDATPLPILTSPVTPPPGSTADERLHLIRAAQRSGDTSGALTLARRLVVDHPLHPPAYLTLGLLLKSTGALHEAITALRRARFLFREDSWLAPYTLAVCLEANGDGSEDRDALEAYRQAAAILEIGGASGLVPREDNEPMLAATVLESCRQRIAVLERV